MKLALPNTIQPDKRQEELHSQMGLMDVLNKLTVSTDTLTKFLVILGSSRTTDDIPDLMTSDITAPSTVLAAAYLVKQQLNSLHAG